jgi:hypothetical protein
MTIGYQGGYAANQRFTDVNGFEHAVQFTLQTDTSRRTSFSLEATGESVLAWTALFGMFSSPTTAQTANGSTLQDRLRSDPAADFAASPLGAMITGTRRISGGIHGRAIRSLSSRSVVQVGVGVFRDAASGPDARASSIYPSVTMGIADGSWTWSASRRTRLILAGTYMSSYTRSYRFDSESATVGWERDLGQRSFVRAEGGYGRSASLGAGGSARNGYTAAGAIGTMQGNHTWSASLRRGVADAWGLAGDSVIAGEGAWSWSRADSPWSASSSLAYERVQGLLTRPYEIWLVRATAARRLGRQCRLVIDGAWGSMAAGTLADYSRRGVRVSFWWSPEADLRH